jgi:dipeptidase E
MKLLLTSNGITNKSIAGALEDLIGKKASKTKVGFIPTAANVESKNKDWFVDQFINLRKFGFVWVDVIDPSAGNVGWRKRLERLDVIFVSGGNTFHLLDQARKTGFLEWLDENKDKKVYVGASAGSVLATPTIAVAGVDNIDENMPDGLPPVTNTKSLNWVTFEFLPHVPDYISHKTAEKYAKITKNKFYAVDDNSAIKVINDKVEVISEGAWNLFNA